jgi:N utilization substance protein A
MRIVDAISRDKNIDREGVLTDLEIAMVSAIRKAYGQEIPATVTIDRLSGDISATVEDRPVSMGELGRIAAQTAKQVMIQKIREAERSSIFDEYSDRKGAIVTGTISRFEGGALIVNMGRTEGFLPKSQQISGESHQPGERIRAIILEVREAPHQVKIILSRSHPDFIRRLFELEVPEVAERTIEIKALAREAGYRTKVAVSSIDTKVDAVGACVGVRGSRIKNIVEELGGEKIDIVRWNESSQILISNALKPAEIQDTALCFELGRATVVVPEDQLSLAIGKRGQNVRLAARLTGWDIDILTPKEYNRGLDRLATTLKQVPGADDVLAEKITLMGMINVMDVEEVGVEPLVEELSIDAELAARIVTTCSEEARKVEVEMETEKREAERVRAEQAAADSDSESSEPETKDDELTPTDDAGAGDAPQAAEPVSDEENPTETSARPIETT